MSSENQSASTSPGRRVPRRTKVSKVASQRRRDLIEAAIRSIASVGYEAVTIISICEEAGFSRGLIGHYFKGKDDLLLEAIEAITTELGEATRQASAGAGPDAIERLHAVIRASFTPPGFTPEKVAVWVALTSTARWSPPLAEIYRRLWKDWREGIGRLFDKAAEQHNLTIDSRLAALTLSQLIEGFWVGWAADPATVTERKAEAACHQYLDMLFAGTGKRNVKPAG